MRTAGALLVLALTGLAGPALATPIVPDQSTEGIGSFSGDITYDGSSGTLTISLTNTSDPANGGYITGFGFNTPDGVSATMDSGTFGSLYSDVDASPFGTFDYAVSLSSNFNGSGAPQGGLAVGETGTFVFQLSGSGLSGLTADDFLAVLSDPGRRGQQAAAFIVRFRGFEDGGSDKVTGKPGTPGNPVPEPGTMGFLAATALLGLSRRRKQQAPAA